MLPVRALVRPACLTGQTNGRLSAAIMAETPGQAGGVGVLLVEPAARAWRALCAAAKAEGHVLKIGWSNSAYRPYADQERIFRDRYTTTYLQGRPHKTWNGRRWYQKPGTAVAAVPGTSNHGWGLAVDVGEERDGDTGTESVDQGTVDWLAANEHLYGFSHELQSEPWHIRYFAGDEIPPAVLAYEAGTPSTEDDMTPEQAQLLAEVHWMLREVKPQTDRLPAIQGSVDMLAWGVLDPGQGLRVMVAALAGREVDDVDEAEVARLVLASLGDAALSAEQVRSIIDAIPGQVKQALREGIG